MAVGLTYPNGASTLNNLQAALDNPVISQKCNVVERILNEYSPKEIHAILPLLVRSIFNFNNNLPGWWISNAGGADFNRLRDLLDPRGPLLQIIYKLTADSACKYEFPLTCLPYPTQCLIEEGTIPSFYMDKIQFNPTGKPFHSLLLNAFEYFMFHFAYFLVNPQLARLTARTSHHSEGFYSYLVSDYLSCFFPLDCSVPPFVQPTNVSPRSSYSLQPDLNRFSRLSPLFTGYGRTSPRNNYPGLIKMDPQFMLPQTSTAVTDPGWIEKETWMSEAILQIFVDFWLNQSTNAIADHHCAHTNPIVSCNAEHVALIRVMIKHLHYFVNTLQVQPIVPYRPSVISHWDEFKGLVWSQYVQKKLYRFLRHSFEWWPLDASFKVVLEAWLSFIQPWRYSDFMETSQSEQETTDVNIDQKWSHFVSDHLLFYNVLFNRFLERAFRIDFRAARNAFMLFRVSKVLSQSNLQEFLQNADNSVQDPFDRFGRPFTRQLNTDASGNTSAIYQPPHNSTTNFALQFTDLEGPRFHYTPLLSHETRKLVLQLVKTCEVSLASARIEVNLSEGNSKRSFFSFFRVSGNHGKDYNATRFYSHDSSEDDSSFGSESKRTVAYLEQAIYNMVEFFRLDYTSTVPPQVTGASADEKNTRPDMEDTGSGIVLTPLGRYQIINGMRKFEISYQGDPDLQPIRSYECAFLVRLLYSISSFINARFSSVMLSTYYRKDFVGRLAQQLLHDDQSDPNPGNICRLPPDVQQQRRSQLTRRRPRLSMRYLASYQLIGYLLLLYLLLSVWRESSIVGYLVTLFLLSFGILLVKAFFSDPIA